MNNFKLYNRILGWAVFLISAFVYISTAEPSTSLWDCGEFIASGYKLQIGHPPGAPFFMMLVRVFTLFAGDNVENVALMANIFSALASAFTIMFLFWSITHLALKITGRENLKQYQLIAVLGSGLVGSLAYTFSDTFWFSAVEGEVYALSSLFTALVFWAILKWENVANQPYANRWLILIAYLMGISIGVHLLNLLAIPAIILVYYLRNYKLTRNGLIKTLIVAAAILGGIMYGIIPGVVWLASKFELLFVNGLGLPYKSGVLIYAVLLLGGLGYGIYYTHKNSKVVLNTVLLCVTVIILGYSSYTAIVIRALANPPMDENSPETVFLLQKYLNREQYGDRPLLTGQYFNAQVTSLKQDKPRWTRKDGKYEITSYKNSYIFDDDFTTVFPRMWSSDPNHIQEYLSWGKIKERDVYYPRRNEAGQILKDRYGNTQYDRNAPKDKPSWGKNMRFFVKYQVGHMYFRYFWWNFSGRQNNLQSHGEVLNGNWITGINAIDKGKVGDEKFMPKSVKDHKARNKYFMLPFLLGMVGFIFHAKRHQKDYWIVLTLFVLTGLAIVIYLNQTPLQPRERDYAYAGSFYAFAIWIGLGVFGLVEFLGKKMQNARAAIAISLACLVLVPGIMANENWDDHNRAKRYTARDIAYNYLNSCAPNAILFTNGDNDTFPLWYLQEVEGVRTDVRVVNLMLLNMDWYVDQVNRKAYESDRLPITVPREKYIEGTNDMAYIQDRIKEPRNAKEIMEFFLSDHEGTKIRAQNGESYDFIPTKKFFLPIDSATVVNNGVVQPEDAHLIEKNIFGSFNGSRFTKSDLIAFDIIANNNWERPIYWVSTAHDALFGLEDYLQLEGLAYRLVPIKSGKASSWEKGRINTNILYQRLMDDFMYRGIKEEDVFLDNFHLRTLNIIRLRFRFNRLANELMAEGKNDKALEVLDKVVDLTPHEKIAYDMFMPGIAETYYKLGEEEKANEILGIMIQDCIDNLEFYRSFKPKMQAHLQNDILTQLRTMQQILAYSQKYEQEEMFNSTRERFMEYHQYFNIE